MLTLTGDRGIVLHDGEVLSASNDTGADIFAVLLREELSADVVGASGPPIEVNGDPERSCLARVERRWGCLSAGCGQEGDEASCELHLEICLESCLW